MKAAKQQPSTEETSPADGIPEPTITEQLALATAAISERIRDLRTSITQKRKALREATHLPVPREDLPARMRQSVRDSGQFWLQKHGADLIDGIGALADPNLSGPVKLPWSHAEAPSWEAICAAYPDTAVAFLQALVERVEYEPGPKLSDRPALVARLTKELEDLETAHEEIVDQAAQNGLSIPHRPEVIQRRALSARQARRDEAVQDAEQKQQVRERGLSKLPAFGGLVQ